MDNMQELTRMVAVTNPIISNEVIRSMMSAEQFIAYCARVSNPSNQNNTETSERLLTYCIKNKHWSPFEMVNVVFEINTTRDIARQILRHRSFSFQEFSQRYADPSQLGFTTKEARMQDEKNRQSSIEVEDYSTDENFRRDVVTCWERRQQMVIDEAKSAYEWATSNGIAKEQARSVLPEGLMQSRLYMNGTLRSWIHYCELRRGNGTQKEHRLIAENIWGQLCGKFSFLKEV